MRNGLDLKEHSVLMMLPNEIKLAEELHDKLKQRIIKQYKNKGAGARD